MPRFGETRRSKLFTEEPAQGREPETQSEPELSAQARYDALLAERAELVATMASHREERERLLHQEEVPALDATRELATRTEAVQLQIEWIDRRLWAVQEAVAEERRAQWEQAWQSHRPGLAEAQERLAAAITEFHAALHHASIIFHGAAAFGDRVSDEFVRPFPEESYNRWALVQYLRTIEQRQGTAPAPAPSMLIEIDRAAGIAATQKFQPRRVAVAEIEAISAIAEPRRVRILHGPLRTSNLQIGIARMLAGETHTVAARAARVLVSSGCAEYLDEETATATAA